MTRITKHRRFLQNVKLLTNTMANIACSPIYNGPASRRAEKKLNKLPQAWQNKVMARADMRLAQYHTPVVTGRDGVEYSAYDMDQQMMKHGC